MNSITLPSAFAESFPSLFEGLKKAWTVFDSIKSFEDVKRVFLMGQGLSRTDWASLNQCITMLFISARSSMFGS